MASTTHRGRAIGRVVGRVAAALAALMLLLLAGAVARSNAEIARLETGAPEEGAPGRFVTVAGRRLHVRVLGDPAADPTGAPIVALHGFAVAGGESWMPWAASLAEGRAVIIPDMLAFGRSERVTAPSPELTHRGQATLLAGLLEAMGVGQFDLVAGSYGGAVGAQYMLDHPGRVRRAVLIDAQVYPSATARFFQSLGGLPLGVGRAVTWHTLGGADGSFNGQRCAAAGAAPCAWLDLARVRGTVDGLRAISATPQDTRVPAELAQIRVPTLVIWGADDQTVPLEEGRRLAAELGAPLEIIPDAGHTPYEDAPKEVLRLVTTFLDQGGR